MKVEDSFFPELLVILYSKKKFEARCTENAGEIRNVY
jgi:hypothetical protein